MSIEVRSPGKLILIGEYAVLEGMPAMVASVDRKAIILIEELSATYYSFAAPNIGINRQKFIPDADGLPEFITPNNEKLNFFKAAFARAWRNRSREKNPVLNIQIDTAAFYYSDQNKMGLGSSAAVTCALIAGLNAVWGKKLLPEDLLSESLAAHHEAQGKMGSGIDIAASVYGGILSYRKKDQLPEIKNIGICENIMVIPIWSGTTASTRELVAHVMRFKKSQSGQYQNMIEQMTDVSVRAIDAWADCNTKMFLLQVHRYNELMQELGERSNAPIISDIHRITGEIVRKYQGVYKPSGAGQGDLGLAFWERSAFDPGFLELLRDEGLQPVDLAFDAQGTVIYN